MVMRTVLNFVTVWCIVSGLAAATTTTATAEVDEIDGQHQERPEEFVDSIMQQLQRAMKDPSGAEIQKLNVTEIATRVVREYVTPSICTYTPKFCARTQLQSRGIQSYLATAGTMFAGTLGVMMTKITILIVFSLVSMIVGKMLLFYAFLTSKHYHHGYHEHISHHSHPHHHGYHHGYHHGFHHKHSHGHGHHHHVPYVKYTKDKYYIKQTPLEHDTVNEPLQSSLSSYQGHSSSPVGSTGVSYYKR